MNVSAGVDKKWSHQNALSSFATVPLKPTGKPITFPLISSKIDTNNTHTCIEWHGSRDLRLAQRPRPIVTEPTDAIIHVTSTTICGSDLHLYHNEIAGMQVKDILGHECMGIIESIGSRVKNFNIGDRVVVSAMIGCGQCEYCMAGLFSNCDYTNHSKEMERTYGHRTSGIFGYSQTTGGYDGCQAEYVRVPYADVNLLKIDNDLPDEKILLLSNTICTGWHANVLGGIGEGNTVAVWGLGSVGLMTVMWAKYRGAKQIVAIDCIEERLAKAREQGAETIDYLKSNAIETVKHIIPGGPDVCIDAVGFRYAKGMMHSMQRAIRLETDTPEILEECITVVRKGGTISVVGDYYHKANQFPIGALMEKGCTLRGGLNHTQSYWKDLLKLIEHGDVDPSFVITHTMPLEQGVEAYKMFDEKKDGAIKIVLKTNFGLAREASQS